MPLDKETTHHINFFAFYQLIPLSTLEWGGSADMLLGAKIRSKILAKMNALLSTNERNIVQVFSQPDPGLKKVRYYEVRMRTLEVSPPGGNLLTGCLSGTEYGANSFITQMNAEITTELAADIDVNNILAYPTEVPDISIRVADTGTYAPNDDLLDLMKVRKIVGRDYVAPSFKISAAGGEIEFSGAADIPAGKMTEVVMKENFIEAVKQTVGKAEFTSVNVLDGFDLSGLEGSDFIFEIGIKELAYLSYNFKDNNIYWVNASTDGLRMRVDQDGNGIPTGANNQLWKYRSVLGRTVRGTNSPGGFRGDLAKELMNWDLLEDRLEVSDTSTLQDAATVRARDNLVWGAAGGSDLFISVAQAYPTITRFWRLINKGSSAANVTAKMNEARSIVAGSNVNPIQSKVVFMPRADDNIITDANIIE